MEENKPLEKSEIRIFLKIAQRLCDVIEKTPEDFRQLAVAEELKKCCEILQVAESATAPYITGYDANKLEKLLAANLALKLSKELISKGEENRVLRSHTQKHTGSVISTAAIILLKFP